MLILRLMVLAPLCFALTGCDWTRRQLDLDLPKSAYVAPEWPPMPTGPLNCKTTDGRPAMCQSTVRAWIETEVKPRFIEMQEILKRVSPVDR